jgi:hypothetical protein
MKKSLAGKLKIKSDHSLLIMRSPDGYITPSTRADVTPRAGKQYDFVQVFIKNKAELDKVFPKAIGAIKPGGLLWISYPKKTASTKSDITRDHGWDTVHAAGYMAVSQVAIDETWSALRFTRAKPKTSAAAKQVKKFIAVLESPDDGIDGAFVSIPYDVEAEYGTKGHIKVKARFDDHPYRGIIANMGTGCHVIIVRKDVRAAIGKNVGDEIKVEIELDTDERTVIIPPTLKDAFTRSPKAEQFFNTLSFTNRKEYAGWISSAKKPETQAKRLSETIRKLLAGKKNPSA